MKNLLNKIEENLVEVGVVIAFIAVMAGLMFAAKTGVNPIDGIKMISASDSITMDNMWIMKAKAKEHDFKDAAEFDTFVKEMIKLETAVAEAGVEDRFFLIADDHEIMNEIDQDDIGKVQGGFSSGIFISFDSIQEHLDAGIDTYDIYLDAANALKELTAHRYK